MCAVAFVSWVPNPELSVPVPLPPALTALSIGTAISGFLIFHSNPGAVTRERSYELQVVQVPNWQLHNFVSVATPLVDAQQRVKNWEVKQRGGCTSVGACPGPNNLVSEPPTPIRTRRKAILLDLQGSLEQLRAENAALSRKVSELDARNDDQEKTLAQVLARGAGEAVRSPSSDGPWPPTPGMAESSLPGDPSTYVSKPVCPGGTCEEPLRDWAPGGGGRSCTRVRCLWKLQDTQTFFATMKWNERVTAGLLAINLGGASVLRLLKFRTPV